MMQTRDKLLDVASKMQLDKLASLSPVAAIRRALSPRSGKAEEEAGRAQDDQVVDSILFHAQRLRWLMACLPFMTHHSSRLA